MIVNFPHCLSLASTNNENQSMPGWPSSQHDSLGSAADVRMPGLQFSSQQWLVECGVAGLMHGNFLGAEVVDILSPFVLCLVISVYGQCVTVWCSLATIATSSITWPWGVEETSHDDCFNLDPDRTCWWRTPLMSMVTKHRELLSAMSSLMPSGLSPINLSTNFPGAESELCWQSMPMVAGLLVL